MSIVASGNFQLQQNQNTATQVVASGGRTLTFSGAAHTVTASSGSFVTDGYVAGGLLTVAGTSSNDGVYVISIVTALVITVSAGMAAEGPLSATATLDGTSNKAFVFASELQNGRYGHYMQSSFSGTDGSLTIVWDTGPGLPTGFTAWGSDGLWLDAKLDARAWGSLEILLTLSVLDPADGTTLVSATRAVTAVDADYARLTIPKATLDAAALAAGDEVRVQFDVTLTTPNGSAYPWIRLGELGADFGSGGGGGSGDVTEVQGTSPIVVTSGTGPIPVVTLPGAALTKTDDTNVTLTLGGSPSTALARAASITAGWSGQLAVSRGGTGAATAADHTVFAGPTSGGPSAPSFRALDAGDLPDLSGTYATTGSLAGYVPTTRNVNTTTPLAGGGALSGDLTLNLGTPAAGTVLKGNGANPSFAALAASDMPTGTDTAYWQVDADGSGPRLKHTSGALDVRDSADSTYAIVRGADPVGANDLVTKGVLDATTFTAGLGLDLLYSSAHTTSGAPSSRTYTIPADTLYAGGTGLRLEVAATCRAGGTDQLSIKIGPSGGTEVFLDVTSTNPTWAASKQIVVHLTLFQPPGSPGSLIVSGHVQDSGDLNAATRQFLNTAIRQTVLSIDTTIDNDLVIAWGNASSAINMVLVRFVGGIPANAPANDGDQPITPAATAYTMPTVMVNEHRTGTVGWYRLSSGTTLGSIVPATYGAAETGGQTSFGYLRFNDWIEFDGAEYTIETVSTTDVKVYTRAIGSGSAPSLVAGATQTLTTNTAWRSGLHVVSNGAQELLVFVCGTSTTLRIVTFDGTTWSTSGNTTVPPTFAAVCAFGVAQANGCLYVPLNDTTATGSVFVANPFSLTGSLVSGPIGGVNGVCCAMAGRVFYMTGSTNSAVQNTLYEIVGGTMIGRKVLTPGAGTGSTVAAAAGCLFPIGDLELIAIYPTNTGSTASAAFYAASKITFADRNDIIPTETVLGSFLDGTLTTAGSVNGLTSTACVVAWVDNETDCGSPQVHLFRSATAGFGTAYAYAQYLGSSTVLSWSACAANPRDYAIPAGDYGGAGLRISSDDTANLIWNRTTLTRNGTVNGRVTATFKFQSQGADTFTVKFFVSTFGGVLLGQATLAGTATGGSAVRVGNEVNVCANNTTHTVDLDFTAMAITNPADVIITPKAFREA